MLLRLRLLGCCCGFKALELSKMDGLLLLFQGSNLEGLLLLFSRVWNLTPWMECMD